MTKNLQIEIDTLVLNGDSPADVRGLEQQLSAALSEELANSGGPKVRPAAGGPSDIARTIAANLPSRLRGDGQR